MSAGELDRTSTDEGGERKGVDNGGGGPLARATSALSQRARLEEGLLRARGQFSLREREREREIIFHRQISSQPDVSP